MKHHPRHTLTEDLDVDSYVLDEGMWNHGRNIILFIGLVAWGLCAFGLISDKSQFFHSYLTAFVYFIAIGLGALFFVMVQFLTGSAWSVPVRRFMETISVTLPAGLFLFTPIALGMNDIYGWTHTKDPLVLSKSAFLNPTAFFIRAAVYFLIWSVWSINIYRQSTKQDRTQSIENMHAASRWSASGLLLLFVSGTLASFDWVMSLDPRWYSTIFGIYVLAGGGLAFMAVVTLISLAFRGVGVMKHTINIEHYHDLGKWLFALTIFWTYIAFSQYLLIWYANIPEETIFFRNRLVGSWRIWSGILLFGHFLIPFLVLLGRAAKRNLKVLGFMAAWTLAMHFVDIYWLVAPNFSKQGVALSWLDFATLIAVGSVFAFVFWWRLKQHAIVPIGDLRFDQGLAFRNI